MQSGQDTHQMTTAPAVSLATPGEGGINFDKFVVNIKVSDQQQLEKSKKALEEIKLELKQYEISEITIFEITSHQNGWVW